jgi:pimeloyl-ACP methyl ester carboxylesterase
MTHFLLRARGGVGPFGEHAVRRIAIAASAAFVLSGCAGQPSPSATASVTPTAAATVNATASAAPTATPVPISGRFDAGNGRQLWIECTGSGTPSIILEAGGESNSAQWVPYIRQTLSAETTTCVYDRAGLNLSSATPRPANMAGVVDDLSGLLAAAHVPGPYLMVGTSFGGQIVLHYALTHQADTAGLVILDTDFPTTDPARDPLGVLLSPAEFAAMRADDVWAQATLAETVALIHPLPGIPIRILTATQPEQDCFPGKTPGFCAQLVQLSTQFQADWLTLSPTAVRVLVDAGHDLPNLAVDIVVAQVDLALKDARAGTP